MLSIFATTAYHEKISQIIAQEDRLSELVEVIDVLEKKPTPSAKSILIKGGNIAFPIDWFNEGPPFLLPEQVDLNEANLLGIIFSKLDNCERSQHYLLGNRSFWTEVDFIHRLQQGMRIDPGELISNYSEFEEYRLMHNQGILRFYAAAPNEFDLEKAIYFFEEALKCAPNEEYAAFTARHFASMFVDLHHASKAIKILESVDRTRLSKEASVEIQHVFCQAWLQKLTIPYDEVLLTKLKDGLWEVLEYYGQNNRSVESGLVLLDASHVANVSESFSESLGYVNRAIKIFDDEGVAELSANGQLRKGTLLYTWAEKGNPQFFKSAVECYQKALKVFTKESAPEVFADIHHHLAVIYSDMPTDTKKKSILAGVSNASFKEALEYFTKDEFPYEYGVICNNFGNAFTKYPPAVLSDNFEKALYYYQEALDVRSADLPYERAITLLNYLEASWNVGNAKEKFNEDRFQDMVLKGKEIKSLVDDQDMLVEAQKHLNLLQELLLAVDLGQ